MSLEGQRSKSLQEYFMKVHIGYLITVCSEVEEKCSILPGVGRRFHWPLEDPAALERPDEEKLSKFRDVRDQIQARVTDWLDEMGDRTE